MRIGVPKEIKDGEHRVALTPAGAGMLVAAGHQVVIQHDAGLDSGFDDAAYRKAGAVIVGSAAEAWDAELVVKVKEPQPSEFDQLRPERTLFTYLHLAAEPELTRVLLEKRIRSIGYETVQLADGSLPLLAPMSHVAGRVALLLAAYYLQAGHGEAKGKGMLLGGIPETEHGHVVVLGGGNAGIQAAEAAAGLGATVTVLDRDEAKVASIRNRYAGRINAEPYSRQVLQELLPVCDVLVGAVLVAGKHAPELLSREMIASMQQGSVLADIAIDQGGISETSRVTSFSEPVYAAEGVVHICLPNLPAAVPRTSTLALTQATLPYVRKLADGGITEAITADEALRAGVNCWDGQLIHPAVASALGLPCSPFGGAS